MADSNAHKAMPPQSKVRIALDFSVQALAKLDEMQEASKAINRSRVDVIRTALATYRYLLMKKQEGYSVSIRLEKGDEVTEAIMNL